jgi:hypothetical protein
LPKLRLNADLKIHKSIYLSGLVYVRTTSLLKSKEIYSTKSIETTTNNTGSGSGISIMNIEEQFGFNLGLICKF